ncbi:hypothetical protein KM043_005483 [Ampulex compressa]|nr:hypothetical protein KM043_005483 [Ampulex compressa]
MTFAKWQPRDEPELAIVVIISASSPEDGRAAQSAESFCNIFSPPSLFGTTRDDSESAASREELRERSSPRFQGNLKGPPLVTIASLIVVEDSQSRRRRRRREKSRNIPEL